MSLVKQLNHAHAEVSGGLSNSASAMIDEPPFMLLRKDDVYHELSSKCSGDGNMQVVLPYFAIINPISQACRADEKR